MMWRLAAEGGSFREVVSLSALVPILVFSIFAHRIHALTVVREKKEKEEEQPDPSYHCQHSLCKWELLLTFALDVIECHLSIKCVLNVLL